MNKSFKFSGFCITFWKSKGIIECDMSTCEDMGLININNIPKGTYIDVMLPNYFPGSRLGTWYKDCFPTRESAIEALYKERDKEILKHKKAIDKLKEMTF